MFSVLNRKHSFWFNTNFEYNIKLLLLKYIFSGFGDRLVNSQQLMGNGTIISFKISEVTLK